MPRVADEASKTSALQKLLAFCREQLPDDVQVTTEQGGHFHDDVTITATDGEHYAHATLPRHAHRTDLMVPGTAVELLKNWAAIKAEANWNLNESE